MPWENSSSVAETAWSSAAGSAGAASTAARSRASPKRLSRPGVSVTPSVKSSSVSPGASSIVAGSDSSYESTAP